MKKRVGHKGNERRAEGREMRNAEDYLKVSVNECDQFRMPDEL